MPAVARLSARRLLRPLVPVWRTAFRDPVVDSHLTLAGTSLVERHAARVGLVTLGGLLASTLLSDVWRRGAMLPTGSETSLVFLPERLLPVTLAAFLVGWTLLLWGALASSAAVRLAVAFLYLVTTAGLSSWPGVEVGDSVAVRYGAELVTVGWLVPGVALVASAPLVLFPRIERWARPVVRLATFAGLAACFLGHLWLHVAYVDEGFPGAVQNLVAVSIGEIDSLLLPLLFVSGVLLVDFSLDVAEGVAEAARDFATGLVRLVLVGLLAVKLWWVVAREADFWSAYLSQSWVSAARTAASMVLLAALVRAVTRYRTTDALDQAKERLVYGTAVVLALPVLVYMVMLGVAVLTVTQLGAEQLPGFVDAYPTDWLVDHGVALVAVAGLALGVGLIRRGGADRPLARDTGSGLVVICGWAAPQLWLQTWDVNPGFSYPLADTLVTLAVLAVLLVRWRRLDNLRLVSLTAFTVFAWLAFSRGDWITALGAIFGLSAVVAVVVGIVYSVASDSGFTRISSRLLPEGARTLLFVGYLVLSANILNWSEVTHAVDVTANAPERAFFLIGIPWAGWLVGRRLFPVTRPTAEPPQFSTDEGRVSPTAG